MRDPIDVADDPLEYLNAEAERQGKPFRLTTESKPEEVRRMAGQLLPRTKDKYALTLARDRLIQPAQRLEQDVRRYTAGGGAADAPPLAEPAWHTPPAPLPVVPFPGDLVRFPIGLEDELMGPISIREVQLSPLTRYDETELLPPLEITFDL